MDKLSIVMPAYNEEKRIRKTLQAYSSYFNILFKKKCLDYELCVVINNTKDKTEEIVREFIRKDPKISYMSLVKPGKGNAIREGFKRLTTGKTDFIGFVDADLATTPEAFYDLLLSLTKNKAGGAIASRYVEGAIVNPKQSLSRIIVSRIYNVLIRSLFFLPYRDTQCGAKIFTKKAISQVLPYLGMTKWAFDLDLIYHVKKLGFKIKETPTVWSDQAYSTINFKKAGLWMALSVLRLRILNSPFKRFVRVYDKFISFVPK